MSIVDVARKDQGEARPDKWYRTDKSRSKRKAKIMNVKASDYGDSMVAVVQKSVYNVYPM